MDEQYRTRVFTVNGIIKPAVLVRGKVVGFTAESAKGDTARLTVSLFSQQSKNAVSAIEREARSLLRFIYPAISKHEISVDILT